MTAREEMAVMLDLKLPPGPEAAARARHSIEELQLDLESEELDTLRLLVSELVSNSVRHAGLGPNDDIRVSVATSPDRIRVEVVDAGVGFDPPRGAPDPESTSGWGLYLVDRLAARWGVRDRRRTRVWFELDRSVSAAS